MAERITVLIEKCTMQINLEPFFKTAQLSSIHKLFKYLFHEPQRNEKAIKALLDYINKKLIEAEANAKMRCADKKAQHLTERWIKIAAAFDKKAAKHSIYTEYTK